MHMPMMQIRHMCMVRMKKKVPMNIRMSFSHLLFVLIVVMEASVGMNRGRAPSLYGDIACR